MTDDPAFAGMSRRSLFAMIGAVAGTAVMYEAMSSLAYAADTTFKGPIELRGAPKGKKVLILGAGLAGMVAAYELQKAGYAVEILEYNDRAGGRNWSLYGGDVYTELGGDAQRVQFDDGLYFNPGPWRIPHHHQGILHYIKLLGVPLQPFLQLNYNAYLHSGQAFGGRPQRFRAIESDFDGYVAELLSKSVRQNALDQAVTKDDQEMLLAALRQWGALDKEYRYLMDDPSSDRRGFDRPPGGGRDARPIPSQPIALDALIQSGLWQSLSTYKKYDMQQSMFQPVGGMGRIGKAFGALLGPIIRYDCKVTAIAQTEQGVSATFVDRVKGGTPQTARADYCLCTIPASILGQIPVAVGPAMRAAIDALSYGAAVKVGLQFKRRFWEEDEHIYGGISYTDTMISQIGYPSSDFFSSGKGVLLGAYTFGPRAVEFTAMSAAQRIRTALDLGTRIHPQYPAEYETGVAVGWHRVPWSLGCAGAWTEDLRARHYDDLCRIDGRIVLAGEHVSHIPAWQEGAVLSSLDAVSRLHQHILAG